MAHFENKQLQSTKAYTLSADQRLRGPENLVKVRIDILLPATWHDTSPRLSATDEKQLHEWLNVKLVSGHVTRSSAANLCRPMLVPKPEEKQKRIVINYIPLNAITIPRRYDPPGVMDTVQRMAKYKYFAKIDIKDAFSHLWIQEEHRHLTAFSTPWGSYEFTRMPQGWSNAPAAWQRYIAWVLQEYWGTNCISYMDDIPIWANTLAQCHAIYRRITKKLQKTRPSHKRTENDRPIYIHHTARTASVA